MAKKQTYVGLEVKKKGRGLQINCGFDFCSWSRNSAAAGFRKYDFEPIIVLTEKEADQMVGMLLPILRPDKNRAKKMERELMQIAAKKCRSRLEARNKKQVAGSDK